MPAAKCDRVYVPRIVRALLVADGYAFAVRPRKRIVPDIFHPCDAPLDYATPTLVVVVVDKPPIGIQDKAWRRGLHVADVRAHARPGGTVVSRHQLELRRRRRTAVFCAGNRKYASAPKAHGRLFRGQLPFLKSGFNGFLLPRAAVVRACERTP